MMKIGFRYQLFLVLLVFYSALLPLAASAEEKSNWTRSDCPRAIKTRIKNDPSLPQKLRCRKSINQFTVEYYFFNPESDQGSLYVYSEELRRLAVFPRDPSFPIRKSGDQSENHPKPLAIEYIRLPESQGEALIYSDKKDRVVSIDFYNRAHQLVKQFIPQSQDEKIFASKVFVRGNLLVKSD